MKVKKIVIGGIAAGYRSSIDLLAVAAAWFRMEGKTNGTIVTLGQTHKYLVYVPKTYDRSKPTPLLINLHPAATRPTTEMEISRWNDLADEHGFIVIYPSGSGFPRVWPMGPRKLERKRPIHFRFDRQTRS